MNAYTVYLTVWVAALGALALWGAKTGPLHRLLAWRKGSARRGAVLWIGLFWGIAALDLIGCWFLIPSDFPVSTPRLGMGAHGPKLPGTISLLGYGLGWMGVRTLITGSKGRVGTTASNAVVLFLWLTLGLALIPLGFRLIAGLRTLTG